MKKSRHGKYQNYKKRILEFLIRQKEDVTATRISIKLNIPKSSCYDVLVKLRYFGYIDWIGEPQDAISMVMITPRGEEYLNDL